MGFNRKNAAAAFKASLPVLTGYVTMGMAAGILLAQSSPAGAVWKAFASSAASISGALQFIMTGWARERIPMTEAALLTLCLNLRYAMYGISLLERWRGIGPFKKSYLIWTLTDETYALEVENRYPAGGDPTGYALGIAAFDHCYWVLGVTAGALLGKNLRFHTRGIDFAMAALFIVFLTDQCGGNGNRMPALAGGAAAIAGYLLFGLKGMLIPAMAMMTVFFMTAYFFTGKREVNK